MREPSTVCGFRRGGGRRIRRPGTEGNGKICYIELPATDIARSAEFYGNVLGWNIRSRGDAVNFTGNGVALAEANPGDYLISAKSCGPSLASGASCAVSLEFEPMAVATRTATLQLTDPSRDLAVRPDTPWASCCTKSSPTGTLFKMASSVRPA